MAATIIYLVISLLVSLIFIMLGIRQYKAEKPVTINTGEKPPREDELTSANNWHSFILTLYDFCGQNCPDTACNILHSEVFQRGLTGNNAGGPFLTVVF